MTIELAQALLNFAIEMTKALAWPFSIVVITIFCRPIIKAIPDILKRPFSVKKGDIEISVAEAQQLKSSPAADISLPSVIPAPPQPAVKIIEDRITKELESYPQASRESILLRALSIQKVISGHEYTYNRIFGSQILALKRLNSKGHATIEDAKVFFQEYAKKYPDLYTSYSFENWISFLSNNALITNEDGILKITEFGISFLMYLTESALTDEKLF